MQNQGIWNMQETRVRAEYLCTQWTILSPSWSITFFEKAQNNDIAIDQLRLELDKTLPVGSTLGRKARCSLYSSDKTSNIFPIYWLNVLSMWLKQSLSSNLPDCKGKSLFLQMISHMTAAVQRFYTRIKTHCNIFVPQSTSSTISTMNRGCFTCINGNKYRNNIQNSATFFVCCACFYY